MNYLEIDANGSKIKLYGSSKQIQSEKDIIGKLNLTGNEGKDRLIIQSCIDKYKIKSDISYNGNTVYPFERIVKSYKKLQKSGDLEKLTKEMYNFFINACGDIAHYNIEGFKVYYDYSFRKLENELLSNTFTSSWHTDVDRIFKKLKIGPYFEDREWININNISINKLKLIINECGWNVTDYNDFWKIESKSINGFLFEIDTTSRRVSDIVTNIQDYCISFNKDEYIEKMVDERNNSSNAMTVREIVGYVDNLSVKLSNLFSDVLYKSRIVAEDIEDMLDQEKNEKIYEDINRYDEAI